MKIDGKRIATSLLKSLKSERKKIRKPILLSVFLVGDAPEQVSFVKMKSKIAKELGIKYRLIHLKKTPIFIDFANLIRKEASDENVTGIVIQQPLPATLATESIYDYIPLKKEIEGHKNKSTFEPPISQAFFTLIKYIYGNRKVDAKYLQDFRLDINMIKKTLKNKKIVLVGRGITGGKPIGRTLTEMKINYINVNSQTQDPDSYYVNADIIITCVGKKVLDPSKLKPGVVLINVGMRREKDRLVGDYDEKAVDRIASYYTPTPGGIGLIDVAFVYRNLIEAAKMQK